MDNKLICKLEWGIGNDRFDAVRCALLEQEINCALAGGAAVVCEIGGMNAESCFAQHPDNRT